MSDPNVIRIDSIDKEILKILRSNARIKLRELARLTHIPTSTIYDRIKRLEKMGLIKKYTTKIDYRLLGYQIKALILASVEGAHIIDVEKEISKNPHVIALYDITGEYDVAIIALFKTIEELDHFVKNLLRNPYVKHTTTSIVFRTVKEEYTLPI
ncbi:Lrp/AsnC family transcriptional regulator [Desulfurococcaceae archaeon MEX13E-LK6-19]|nr:Lrp/AsnC family transcriptional regulator [Desulfurococcaceae archaeon MEX13E-LK6-19]